MQRYRVTFQLPGKTRPQERILVPLPDTEGLDPSQRFGLSGAEIIEIEPGEDEPLNGA